MPENITPTPTTPVTENNTNQDEVEKRINAAVEREKSKLYDTIKNKEQKAKEATDKAIALEARLLELEQERKNRELAELGVTERLQKQLEYAQQKADEALRLARDREVEADRYREEVRLERYKDLLIREAGLDAEFVDFIRGNTEEEIVKSVERAASIQKKYRTAAPPATPSVPQAAPPTAPASPHPNILVDVPDIRFVDSAEKLLEYKRRIGLRRN